MERKPTIFVFAMPFYGHVNPVLTLLQALVNDGFRVVVFDTDEFAEMLTATGAEFRSTSPFYREFTPEMGHNLYQLAELVLDITEDVMPELIRILTEEQPNLILHDSYCLWAKLAAAHVRIPAASYVTTLAFDYYVFMSYPKVAAPQMAKLLLNPEKLARVILRHRSMVAKYGASYIEPADLFYNREQLNIVFTSRYFQPWDDRFGDDFAFIGPSIRARKELPPEPLPFPSQRPVVYVSFGTIYNQDVSFYRLAVDALADVGCNLLLSIGKNNKVEDIGRVPPNVIVRQFVNQISVLEQSSGFVSHGGMNSINESMYYGVPMVLFPVVQEQGFNAERVGQLGAGIVMDRSSVSADKLRDSVVKILSDRSYKEQAQKIRKTLLAAGGEQEAVRRIRELLRQEQGR
ncbi:MAG: hypothetical protein N2691_04710 [Patescibacteria group bacterium]|nr:hypothetical protein [Patescibacteria group bacterium]